MRNAFLVTLLLSTAAHTAAAQANPVSTTIRTLAMQRAKDLVDAAEAMPAGRYGFKPTPAQMTFGAIIAHIQSDNRTTCSALSGIPAYADPSVPASAGKAKLVASLKRSIVFCQTALGRLSDSRLGDGVTWYGEKTTRSTPAIGILTDWTDHYAQAAMYLRLNDIVPPSARR